MKWTFWSRIFVLLLVFVGDNFLSPAYARIHFDNPFANPADVLQTLLTKEQPQKQNRFAVTSCTPSSGYDSCRRYTASGANQTFVVPSGVTVIYVILWGAGGGGPDGTYSASPGAGAGGYTLASAVAVTPGETLNITVGKGGQTASLTGTFGGGGPGGAGVLARGSSGGGGTFIWRGAPFSGTLLLSAGGGGGASSGATGFLDANYGPGGGGGGTSGATGGTRTGLPGTSSFGGGTVSTPVPCATPATSGSQYQGGAGGSDTSAVSEGGGGGGGGYYGGGGGPCQPTSALNTANGGGGGGSGFIGSVGGSSAGGSGTANAGGVPQGNTDAQYVAGIAVGGYCAGSSCPGGDGMAVIQWENPTMRIRKRSTGGVGTFNFTGTNGYSAEAITTVTPGTIRTGTTQTLTSIGVATTITEAAVAGFTLTDIACTGLGSGGTATVNLGSRQVTLNAAATVSGSNITCTFTNKAPVSLSLRTTWVNGKVNDAVTLSSSGFPSNTSVNSISTGNNSTTSSAVSLLSGDVGTISQSFTTGSASNYNSTLSCTGNDTPLSGNQLTIGVSDTSVLCTMTNTRIQATAAVSKSSSPATGTEVLPGDTITYTLQTVLSNAANAANLILTDTLTAGQTAGAMPPGCSIAGQVITCTLPAETVPGTYNFTYTTTVNPGVTGSVGNSVVVSGGGSTTTTSCTNCTTTHPIKPATIAVSKSSNPATGTSVGAGDSITYTLQAVIGLTNTSSPLVLTDTLSAGQTRGALPAGCTASGQVITCTIPAGTVPGTYSFAYPATVNSTATGSVSNSVVPTGGSTNAPTCSNCTTTHPVKPATIAVSKSSNPATGTSVGAGDSITYTLQAVISTAANASPLVLTDTLSAGQTRGTLPAGCTASGQVITCTIAAGTAPGTYSFAYPATVNSTATGSVSNSVVPTGGSTNAPTCSNCTTTHPVKPAIIAVSKSSNPATGTAVGAGDSITYTLQAVISTAANASPLVLTDTLSAGQTIGTLPAGCTASGQVITCTIAAGTAPGTYSFAYPATVNSTRTGSVSNTVVPTGGSSTAPTCSTCTTTHPIKPAIIAVSKSSNPATGIAVGAGDSITYTLQAVISTAANASPLVLTDTLSAGQTIGTLPAGCTASGQVITCTIAAGTAPGTYSFAYPATVNSTTTGSVSNSVVPTGGSSTAPTCTNCTTTHPIAPAIIAVSKSASPASGTAVVAGDSIDYSLQAVISSAANASPLVLTDTLSAGQTIGTLPAGCTASGQVITCTIPAGTAPGTYSFTYPATVNQTATISVDNSVVPTGGSATTPTCTNCTTTHPIAPAIIAVSKSASPATGTTVVPGDIIDYTLQAVISTAANASPLVLTDTLSAGQTIGTLPAGCTASGQVITCTIPAGTAPGTYSFTYPATVSQTATVSVDNSVVPTGGSSTAPSCTNCTTTHPIAPAIIAVSKSSVPATGTTVDAGTTIDYSLQAIISTAANASDLVLTDTLSSGQTLETLPAGCTASGQVITCTLPAGTAPGTYTFTYDVAVDGNASGTVSNTVVPSGGSATTPTCTNCSTTHTVTPATILVSKSSNPASGTVVAAGDTVDYTLQADISLSGNDSDLILTDTLSAGQTLGTLPAGCTVAGLVITCTLPANSTPGTYTFTYPVTVDQTAITQIKNKVVPTGGSSSGVACMHCSTTHPIAPAIIAVSKSSVPATGTTVVAGDAIDYSLEAVIGTAANESDLVLTDTLSAGLTIGTLPAGCTATGQVITCTIPAGTAPGTYSFTYPATVNQTATVSVDNSVVPTGGSATAPTCTNCTTTHPIAPAIIAVSKSSNPATGTTVAAGDSIDYSLQAVIGTAANESDLVLTDTLSAGQTIGTLPAGCTASGQVITCTIPAGTAPGTYSFTYPATVNQTATVSVDNSVVPTGGSATAPTCTNCTTTHPIAPAIIAVSKSASPATGTAVAAGDTIDYSLQAVIGTAANESDLVLTDTLSAGQTIGTLPAGCTASGQVITCTIPAGTAPGTYSFTYPATVNQTATVSVDNSVVPTGGSATAPTCTNCTTTHPIAPAIIAVSNSSNPATGTAVAAGDTIDYSLQAVIGTAANESDLVLTDTLSSGQTLGTLPAGCTATGQVVTCTIPAGTAPGTYSFTYPATVNQTATVSVSNAVVPTGGSTTTPTCTTCTTTHPIAPAIIAVSNSANPATGTVVAAGDTIDYSLQAVITTAANESDLVLTDTLSSGQTLGTLPAGCTASGQVVTCTIPAGTAPGTYSFTYPTTVNQTATGSVSNAVVPTGGSTTTPTC
ncbi:prealbumin-like fold domain-containing protein, partial [Legionella sp. CNM-4043-24]|uniref:prealbumin-like fold domain-containing protein n=1 Tax=Legionella sp. CNM-4043-24 TaxID=3421646 RepID=UPI00403AEA70